MNARHVDCSRFAADSPRSRTRGARPRHRARDDVGEVRLARVVAPSARPSVRARDARVLDLDAHERPHARLVEERVREVDHRDEVRAVRVGRPRPRRQHARAHDLVLVEGRVRRLKLLARAPRAAWCRADVAARLGAVLLAPLLHRLARGDAACGAPRARASPRCRRGCGCA